MSNPYFNASGSPADGSELTSSTMRTEFAAIAAGFDKLPTLSGNGYKLVSVNASASGLDVSSTISIGGGGKTLSLTGEGSSFLEIDSSTATPIVRAGGGVSYMQLDDSRFIGAIQFAAGVSWVWEPGSVFASRGIHDSAGARALTITGSGANSITLANSATNPTLGTTAGDLSVSARLQATVGLTVSGGTFTSRGVADNATATALTLSGSGANSVTIANSATTPTIGTTAGALAITAAIAATSTFSAAGSVQANNDDATPVGGAPGIAFLIGSAGIGIYIGSGVPSVSAVDGSVYIRTDGLVGAAFYQRRSGAWVATLA